MRWVSLFCRVDGCGIIGGQFAVTIQQRPINPPIDLIIQQGPIDRAGSIKPAEMVCISLPVGSYDRGATVALVR
jgi:hypothetical protein